VAVVLLVGRAPALRHALAEELRRGGHTVRETDDARAALARLDAHACDAIVIDTAADRRPPPVTVTAASAGVAVDPHMRALFAGLGRVASADSTVLITGETGTGKELVARAIYARSRRRAHFVPVNCGALPDALVESELFGHKKGAFTGAWADKPGLVEEAEGGVLFLDEIGEMPMPLQVRLLRFLDSGEVRRVGDTSVRHVDVRIIAATNRSLEEDVDAGRFRRDLFYRLNVISLHLPPLRDRPRDIPALAQHALAASAGRLRKDVRGFSYEALRLLQAYAWPGNVRQLQSVVESAAVAAGGDTIAEDDLPACVKPLARLVKREPLLSPEADVDRLTRALARSGGNQTHAAASLGISRTTLWRRLRRVETVRESLNV